MSENKKLNKLNSRTIGSVFAISLLIPQNIGIDLLGINFEDIPVIVIFLVLFILKIQNFTLQKFDILFLSFLGLFAIYTTFLVSEIKLFNQTNLRFYFYFMLSYLCIDLLQKKEDKVIDFFEPLGIVMIANFLVIIFQVQLPGNIDGWILNNSASTNPFSSGRLGGLQGGGPNVIGIICAIYTIVCAYKVITSSDIKISILKHRLNTSLLLISLINLIFTYSRGSYLALCFGLTALIMFSNNLDRNIKTYLISSFGLLVIFSIYTFPGIFLKETNRTFLNSLGIKNTEIFVGVGGGNYIKSVYKEYLLTLDEDLLFDEFNIKYNEEEKTMFLNNNQDQNLSSVEGFLKLKFDYQDNFLPRSIVSFYYSNDGLDWNQLGFDHTKGVIINLIENDSFFEVGGWGDGQSPDDQALSGYLKSVIIETDVYKRKYRFNEDKRDIDYLLLTPLNKNQYESPVEYKNNSIFLERPRKYWVALPNEVNLSGQDFEITLELDLKSVPKGHETLFSQSSILRLNEEFNDQSWKWSIINGRMYFFWIENVTSGYSNFVGGQSLRSGKLITSNGNFDSTISEFSLSQYDEITTSHNGFLTMAVEYGLFPITIIISIIIYSIIKNLKKINQLEIILFLMFLIQNFTNDLLYAPDIALYFWLIPIYFISSFLRVKN